MPDKFAIYNTPEHAGKKWISQSQASLVLNCPWSWWARYKGGFESVPSVAVDRGMFFDGLCEHGEDVILSDLEVRATATRLSQVDMTTIVLRAQAQRATMPPGKGQVPLWMPLEGTDWHLRGFVDWLPDDPTLPFIEIKLATTPWLRRKLAYNRMQPISYTKMLDGRPGQFDVSNMAEPGIQVFTEKDYLGRKPFDVRWDETLKQYQKAIKLIEGKVHKPTPGILCKGSNVNGSWICDYWAVCPDIIEKKNKEMKINELRKCF